MGLMNSTMKTFKLLIIIVFTILCVTSVYGQVVVRVLKGYILIDTDKGIGKLNEKIKAYSLC